MNRRRLFQALSAGAAAPVLARLPELEAEASPTPTGLALVGDDGPEVLWLPDTGVVVPDVSQLPGFVTQMNLSYENDLHYPGIMTGPYDRRRMAVRGDMRVSLDFTVEMYGRVDKETLLAIIARDLDRLPL